ncbi:MAG TPA: hypothetical protein VK255_00605, partial [Patescibacteria group bacterium]|nr:hypothetical protein [Patescibacteria group bacterium]
SNSSFTPLLFMLIKLAVNDDSCRIYLLVVIEFLSKQIFTSKPQLLFKDLTDCQYSQKWLISNQQIQDTENCR